MFFCFFKIMKFLLVLFLSKHIKQPGLCGEVGNCSFYVEEVFSVQKIKNSLILRPESCLRGRFMSLCQILCQNYILLAGKSGHASRFWWFLPDYFVNLDERSRVLLNMSSFCLQFSILFPKSAFSRSLSGCKLKNNNVSKHFSSFDVVILLIWGIVTCQLCYLGFAWVHEAFLLCFWDFNIFHFLRKQILIWVIFLSKHTKHPGLYPLRTTCFGCSVTTEWTWIAFRIVYGAPFFAVLRKIRISQ